MSAPDRLRAPQRNGDVVAAPPLSEVGALLDVNRSRLTRPWRAIPDRVKADLLRLLRWAAGGSPSHAAPDRVLAELQQDARRAVIAAARDYLQAAGEPLPALPSDRILMAGHQPELFHPGVWVKNFALCGLAKKHGLVPINLVVDNDTAKATALHVPSLGTHGSDAEVRRVTIPYDVWTDEVPYEERVVRDEALFASLPERIAPLQQGWGFEPLFPSFWAEVLRQAKRTPLLGERLAAARRTLERRWGCHNLEVPVSRVCQTEPFARFACLLLFQLPRFHQIYNDCVHDYRRRHGIRSRHHPVPDLAAEQGWLEAPFWAWRSGQRRRGRLLARLEGDTLRLRVGNEQGPSIPCKSLREAGPAWQELERHGFKVRSRALTNTLFARLFLTDLFIHGIGGGKYDELTDEIIRRFYQVEPPHYLVLSATLLLPLPAFPAGPEECHRLARQQRDLFYNPQRHLEPAQVSDPIVRSVAEQKQAWIARQPADAKERRERFETLKALTAQLQPIMAGRIDELRHRVTQCEHQVQANVVLRRRDYAFCLYPEATVREFCSCFLT